MNPLFCPPVGAGVGVVRDAASLGTLTAVGVLGVWGPKREEKRKKNDKKKEKKRRGKRKKKDMKIERKRGGKREVEGKKGRGMG